MPSRCAGTCPGGIASLFAHGDACDSDGHASIATGAFFGRRKGHALRAAQAALFETLLPRLALDLARRRPPTCATLFAGVERGPA